MQAGCVELSYLRHPDRTLLPPDRQDRTNIRTTKCCRLQVCYDGPRLVSFVLFSDELHVHTSVEGATRQTKCDQLGRDYANIVPLK